jgi:hypothetical protein
MSLVDPKIIKIIGSGFMIGGIISLIVSVFDYKNNFTAALTGYFFMAILLIMLLTLIFTKYSTVNKALVWINAFPFIILLVSIICLIIILLQYQSSIDGAYVSMQYYSKSSNALLTLLLIIIIYGSSLSTEMYKSNPTNLPSNAPIMDVDIPFIVLFFALWFFGYVVVIRDILKYNTTDDRNEYYITLTEEN